MFLVYFLTNAWLGAPNVEAAKDPANVLFYVIPPMKWIPITLPGIIYAFAMISRFTGIISVLRLITLVTPIRDMVLGAVKCKTPPRVALTVSIAFAFIPVIVQSMTTITEAVKTRAWRGLERGNPITKLKALIPVFFPLVMLTVERSQHIAVAIEARGFSHKISKRTYLREISLTKADYATMAFLLMLAAVCLAANRMGYGTWEMTMSLLRGR